MSKTVLLAAAAAFALTAGGASAATLSAGVTHAKATPVVHHAKGAKMLYNQNSGSSVGLLSSNFTSGSFPSASSQGADDFVVPKKQQWTVTEVDAAGVYFNGYGPATSEDVTFYADNKGVPGNAVKGGTFTGLNGTDSNGSFNISLGKGVKLKSGTYWVSVVTNQNFGGGAGEWGWSVDSTTHGNSAMWQNPGGYFGVCQTWGTIGNCLGYSGDFAFDLQGSKKKKK